MSPDELLKLDEMSVRNRVLKLLEIEGNLTREIRRLHSELDVTPIKNRLAAEIAEKEQTLAVLKMQVNGMKNEHSQAKDQLLGVQELVKAESEAYARMRTKKEKEIVDLQDHFVDLSKKVRDIRSTISLANGELNKLIERRYEEEIRYDGMIQAKRGELRSMENKLHETMAGIKSIERKRRDLERRSFFLEQWEDRLWTREHDVNMLSERIRPEYEKLFPEDKINLEAFKPSHEHGLLHEEN